MLRHWCKSYKHIAATVFRLPSANDDLEERKRWIQSIPRDNIPDTKDTVVCEDHFPEGYDKIKVRHQGQISSKKPTNDI